MRISSDIPHCLWAAVHGLDAVRWAFGKLELRLLLVSVPEANLSPPCMLGMPGLCSLAGVMEVVNAQVFSAPCFLWPPMLCLLSHQG